MYDETYGVIYEVIALKMQGVHGAFLKLENRYICRVSDTCIQRIHYKLSATFSGKHRRPNFTRSLG